MLPLFLALILLLIGTVLLVFGADWFLDGAGDLARALGISALVLGVLLAGLEPEEMLTAAIASGRSAPALAVGNVIGTNVTIVTVALGLSALIFRLGPPCCPALSGCGHSTGRNAPAGGVCWLHHLPLSGRSGGGQAYGRV